MKPRSFALFVRGFGPALLLCAPMVSFADSTEIDISNERQIELVRLVRNDCGSCHGITLKGGLGSPLTTDSLSGKPDEQLRETILRGRTGTAMPGWADFMNDQEAQWIVNNLKTGFPNVR